MKQDAIVSLFALAALACAGAAHAQDVEAFYKGRQVTLMVGNAPGGGNDAYARLTARHLGRFIPGNPVFVVQNMPGAGGLRVVQHMYNVAPKDGSALALPQRANLTAPLLEAAAKNAPFDILKFNWLGSINSDEGFIMVWHTTPHHTMDDLARHELIVGSANPTSETIPYFLNNVFGAKIKVVAGYKSGTEIIAAMEKGEVQARILGSIAGPWPLIEPLYKQDKVRFLAAITPRRSPRMPGVPTLKEFARNKQQEQMMDLLLASQLWGRPFMMPPGVPGGRVQAAREALYKMTDDKEFLEEAAKLKLDIDLLKGEEMEQILKDLYSTPPDVIEATLKAVEHK